MFIEQIETISMVEDSLYFNTIILTQEKGPLIYSVLLLEFLLLESWKES